MGIKYIIADIFGSIWMYDFIRSCSMSSCEYLIPRSEKGFDTTGSQVKADALKEINLFCSKKYMQIEVTSKAMFSFKYDAQAKLEFRCKEL